jgi:hypothetical protein
MRFFIAIPDSWLLFSICICLATACSYWMMQMARNFFTRDGSMHSFSIMDLEFPSSAKNFANLINGIYKLDPELSKKCLRSLKLNLWVDFLFMPAIYGSIFILCMHVAAHTHYIGPTIFGVVGWLQILAWILDIYENTFLLKNIKNNLLPVSDSAHKFYTNCVKLKWAIASLGGICSLMVFVYFWLTGSFVPSHYLAVFGVVAIEFGVLILLRKLFSAGN